MFKEQIANLKLLAQIMAYAISPLGNLSLGKCPTRPSLQDTWNLDNPVSKLMVIPSSLGNLPILININFEKINFNSEQTGWFS